MLSLNQVVINKRVLFSFDFGLVLFRVCLCFVIWYRSYHFCVSCHICKCHFGEKEWFVLEDIDGGSRFSMKVHFRRMVIEEELKRDWRNQAKMTDGDCLGLTFMVCFDCQTIKRWMSITDTLKVVFLFSHIWQMSERGKGYRWMQSRLKIELKKRGRLSPEKVHTQTTSRARGQ